MKKVNHFSKSYVFQRLLFVYLSLFVITKITFSQQFSFSGRNDGTYLRLNEISSKAAKHFANNFLNKPNVKWTKDDDCYIASFSTAMILSRVYYNSGGDFINYIKCYTAADMDQEFKSVILAKFQGYDIKTITEVNNLETKTYFIKITNKDFLKTIKCIGANIEVVEDLINGGA